MVETRPTASATEQPACLLIAPAGCDLPSDLLDGLRSRGVRVREVSDAPAVMAELAAGSNRILIIVEPTAVRDAEPLVAAVRRYHPGVSVWRYAMQLDPPLQPWPGKAEDQPAAGQSDTLHVEDAHDRPTTEEDRPAVFGGGGAQAPLHDMDDVDQPESPLITEEELAMLLGDEDEGEAHS